MRRSEGNKPLTVYSQNEDFAGLDTYYGWITGVHAPQQALYNYYEILHVVQNDERYRRHSKIKRKHTITQCV